MVSSSCYFFFAPPFLLSISASRYPKADFVAHVLVTRYKKLLGTRNASNMDEPQKVEEHIDGHEEGGDEEVWIKLFSPVLVFSSFA